MSTAVFELEGVGSVAPTTALEDDRVVDVTPQAKALGFNVRVDITYAAWQKHVEPTPVALALKQDVHSRLFEILFVCGNLLRLSKGKTTLLCRVRLVMDQPKALPVTFRVTVVESDGEPVVKIALPE